LRAADALGVDEQTALGQVSVFIDGGQRALQIERDATTRGRFLRRSWRRWCCEIAARMSAAQAGEPGA
jgi:hypothetical protein